MIQLNRLLPYLDLEPVLALTFLSLASYGVYLIWLKRLTSERHERMKSLFRDLIQYHMVFYAGFGAFKGLFLLGQRDQFWFEALANRILPYVGVLTILGGATIVIKVSRIAAFEYLFAKSMRAGVPVLLINIFTLGGSLIVYGWVLADLFNVRLLPVIATSAALSVVLGLALQDTLGNLFAGISLQFDKLFEIGDWIEVSSGMQKWVGKVEELSWRSTELVGLADERISIPNRIVAQSQIAIFENSGRPFIRSVSFRLPITTDLDHIREPLIQAALSETGIVSNPRPKVFCQEMDDSAKIVKLIYWLTDYAEIIPISSAIHQKCLAELERRRIPIVSRRVSVSMENHT